MADGRSLTKFYVGLALVAVTGTLVLVRAGSSKPPLTADTFAPLATGPRGVVMGSDSARVEIMEFSDFECPFCARFAVLQMPDAERRLVSTGKARWRFVNFPLNIHAKSPYAHLAAACAAQQGKFWQTADLIYQNQEEWADSRSYEKLIDGYAERAGVDRSRYRSCIDNRSAWGQVFADKRLADSLNLSGTPTFFVNGRELPDRPEVTVDLLVHIVDSLEAQPVAARGARPAGR